MVVTERLMANTTDRLILDPPSSWVSYARPFARRRAIYREKARKFFEWKNWELFTGANYAREAVEHLWAEFRDELLRPMTPERELEVRMTLFPRG